MLEASRYYCLGCGDHLGNLWIEKGRRFCIECDKKRKGIELTEADHRNTKSIEISRHYFGTINNLKRMVSHSRKGKPHKQSWGFHIVNS